MAKGSGPAASLEGAIETRRQRRKGWRNWRRQPGLMAKWRAAASALAAAYGENKAGVAA